VTTRAVTARSYVAIAALLILGALFASLGTWQLRRAEASRETFTSFAARAAEAPLATLPSGFDETQRFRRIAVHGEYLRAPQLLLDNMLHDGVAGYHVLTSLRVAGRRELVLVNRGWVPLGTDRGTLPDVAVDARAREIVGRLERLPRPGIRLGGADPVGDAAVAIVMQYPTAEDVERALGEPVLDYQLLLDSAEADGYVRDWRAPGMQPERHLSYAGQWFALAIGAIAAGVVIAWKTARPRS
jgi:surfeit locus 1 family protein